MSVNFSIPDQIAASIAFDHFGGFLGQVNDLSQKYSRIDLLALLKLVSPVSMHETIEEHFNLLDFFGDTLREHEPIFLFPNKQVSVGDEETPSTPK